MEEDLADTIICFVCFVICLLILISVVIGLETDNPIQKLCVQQQFVITVQNQRK